jgi:hypothetical protein
MTGTKPKIGKHHPRRLTRNAGLARKEFVTEVLGLESRTFDIGNAKYTAKYQKTADALPTTSKRSTREDQISQRQSVS